MIEMTAGAAVGIVGILITLGGIVFHAGRQSARIESLETWRSEVRGELREIKTAVDFVVKLIKGEEV